jgi:hypothetical protein
LPQKESGRTPARFSELRRGHPPANPRDHASIPDLQVLHIFRSLAPAIKPSGNIIESPRRDLSLLIRFEVQISGLFSLVF